MNPVAAGRAGREEAPASKKQLTVDCLLARSDPGGMSEVEAAEVPGLARALEAAGYAGVCTTEAAHDPFLPLALAAGSTSTLRLGTAIALAFPRSPMVVAHTARDLHRLSSGRFALGLGSQIKAHITRRFGMSWSPPVARMREYIGAIRAIWRSWEEGVPLRFEGEHYRHTLSVPLTNPGPSGFGTPPILLAAVGKRMTELAGEVADGIVVHAFTTPSYLRSVTLPAVARGCARAGRSINEIEVVVPAFVVTDEITDRSTRMQIAFYGSTPAYRPVLDHHGWGDLQTELHALSLRGRWTEMGALIPDDVLSAFAVSGDAKDVSADLANRFDVADRIVLTVPPLGIGSMGAVVRALRRV